MADPHEDRRLVVTKIADAEALILSCAERTERPTGAIPRLDQQPALEAATDETGRRDHAGFSAVGVSAVLA